MNAFDLLGRDLHAALERKVATRRRLKRAARAGAVALAVATFSTTVAVASTGVSFGDLDPTKWTILGRGEVDGRASYVNARNNETGDEATFLEARDDGLDRYEAFTLHQRALAAAGSLPNEAGITCTADELDTRRDRGARDAGRNRPAWSLEGCGDCSSGRCDASGLRGSALARACITPESGRDGSTRARSPSRCSCQGPGRPPRAKSDQALHAPVRKRDAGDGDRDEAGGAEQARPSVDRVRPAEA